MIRGYFFAIVLLALPANVLPAPDWSNRTAIRYPWLKRAVTLAECDNRQRRTPYVTTGTMTTVIYDGRNFIYENSCAYRRKNVRRADAGVRPDRGEGQDRGCRMKRGENLRKHGLTRSPEHRSWLSMMTRCLWSDPSRNDWHLYQGKGIRICERWLIFSNFLEDMGPKPTLRHTLDRIDSDRHYEPGNCRWATPKEQARNWKHRNVKFTHNGESLTLPEWAERLHMTRESLRDRIQSGWSIARALSTPPIRNHQRNDDGTFATVGG
jgi:hypothetical protein